MWNIVHSAIKYYIGAGSESEAVVMFNFVFWGDHLEQKD